MDRVPPELWIETALRCRAPAVRALAALDRRTAARFRALAPSLFPGLAGVVSLPASAPALAHCQGRSRTLRFPEGEFRRTADGYSWHQAAEGGAEGGAGGGAGGGGGAVGGAGGGGGAVGEGAEGGGGEGGGAEGGGGEGGGAEGGTGRGGAGGVVVDGGDPYLHGYTPYYDVAVSSATVLMDITQRRSGTRHAAAWPLFSIQGPRCAIYDGGGVKLLGPVSAQRVPLPRDWISPGFVSVAKLAVSARACLAQSPNLCAAGACASLTPSADLLRCVRERAEAKRRKYWLYERGGAEAAWEGPQVSLLYLTASHAYGARLWKQRSDGGWETSASVSACAVTDMVVIERMGVAPGNRGKVDYFGVAAGVSCRHVVGSVAASEDGSVIVVSFTGFSEEPKGAEGAEGAGPPDVEGWCREVILFSPALGELHRFRCEDLSNGELAGYVQGRTYYSCDSLVCWW